MGLHIRAYSRCRFVAPKTENDWDEHEDVHIYVHALDVFRDRLDGLAPGWYASEGEYRHFHAGSYGGYNRWRDQLSRAALGVPASEVWGHFSRFAGRPFAELINFADNEGTIGPRTSAKLLADFDADPALPTRVADDPFDYFAEKYAEWRNAFALAADNGLVVFS